MGAKIVTSGRAEGLGYVRIMLGSSAGWGGADGGVEGVLWRKGRWCELAGAVAVVYALPDGSCGGGIHSATGLGGAQWCGEAS